jgi:hypothetical protein
LRKKQRIEDYEQTEEQKEEMKVDDLPEENIIDDEVDYEEN